MLTKGFFAKKYNSIMIASLLGWLASILGTLSDSIFGGLFISEEAVSATGLVSPIFSIVLFVSTLFAVGTANEFSNYMGAYDKEKAHKTVYVGVLTSLVVGAIFAILMYIGEDIYFAFYDAGEIIESLARQYYECFIIYCFMNPIYWVIYYLVSRDGDTKTILAIDVVSAFGNILISIILVNFLGIRGLALGTVFALVINALQLIPHFLSKRNSIGIIFKYDFKFLKQILISGSSYSLAPLYIGVVDIVMNKFVIVAFGAQYLAAYAVVNLIINLTNVLSCASDGALPFIGISYGENNTVFLKKIINRTVITSIIVSLILTVLMISFSSSIPNVYGIENVEVFNVSVYSARILPLSFAFSGIIIIWINIFSMIGMPILGNVVSFTTNLVFPLSLGVLLGSLFSFKGLVCGLALAWPLTCILVLLIIWFTKGKEAFPYGFKDSSSKIFIYELKVCDEEIIELQNQIKKDLLPLNISDKIINKIQLTIEETLEIVKEKNEKEVLGDCTLIVDDKMVSLTTRDNGVIFDITKESEELKSLRDYVVSSLINNTSQTKYLTTISFNRNNFVWEK